MLTDVWDATSTTATAYFQLRIHSKPDKMFSSVSAFILVFNSSALLCCFRHHCVSEWEESPSSLPSHSTLKFYYFSYRLHFNFEQSQDFELNLNFSFFSVYFKYLNYGWVYNGCVLPCLKCVTWPVMSPTDPLLLLKKKNHQAIELFTCVELRDVVQLSLPSAVQPLLFRPYISSLSS